MGEWGATRDGTAHTRGTYDRIAGRYAEQQGGDRATQPPLFAQLESSFLSLLPPGALILDVGCGPGFDAALFRRRGCRVVGIDLSHAMLAIAAPALAGRVLQADMRALPLAEGSADGVWSVASLLHVPDADTAKVIGEWHRVLRGGGVLALVTAVDGRSGFEAVPYAEGEERWFVYRDEGALYEGIVGAGFALRARAQVSGSRRWATYLVQKG